MTLLLFQHAQLFQNITGLLASQQSTNQFQLKLNALCLKAILNKQSKPWAIEIES